MKTKQRLLRAAQAVCRDEGIERLTMRRIAARARVSAPAIYRHFDSKAAVLQALVDEANAKLATFLEAAGGASDDPLETLRGAVRAMLEFAVADPAAYDTLFFSRERRDGDLLPHARRSPNFRRLLDRVATCRKHGLLRPDVDDLQVGLALWAMGHGVRGMHVQGRFGGDEALLRKVFRDCLEQLFVGVLAPRKRA